MQLIKFLYTGSYITMHLRYALCGKWMNVVCMPGDICSAFTCGSAEHEDRCWLEFILEIRFLFSVLKPVHVVFLAPGGVNHIIGVVMSCLLQRRY